MTLTYSITNFSTYSAILLIESKQSLKITKLNSSLGKESFISGKFLISRQVDLEIAPRVKSIKKLIRVRHRILIFCRKMLSRIKLHSTWLKKV